MTDRFLLLQNPPLCGPEVDELVRRLVQVGRLPLDAPPTAFDEEVYRAVRDYQDALGLDVDGRVGDGTWKGIRLLEKRAAVLVTAWGFAKAGIHEGMIRNEDGELVGDNRTIFGRLENEDGVPWCALSAHQILLLNGLHLCDDKASRDSCPGIEAWARKHGVWIPPDAGLEQPADLVLFGEKSAHHVGILRYCRKTWEGNYGDAYKGARIGSRAVRGYVNLYGDMPTEAA